MAARAKPKKLSEMEKEIEALKKENERLRVTGTAGKRPPRAARYVRNGFIGFLVGAAVILLTAANLFFWFGNTVVKQDRFVAATQPIIRDPAVQESMALYVTNAVFNNIDVQEVTTKALPDRADFLAPQLTAQLKSSTQTTMQSALASPDIQNKWNQVLAKQHDRLISLASNYEGDGTISLNDVYNQTSARLSGTKLSFLADKQLPSGVGEVTIIKAKWLPAFHKLVTTIDTWRLLAVILLVTALGSAAWLSRNRRRTIYVFSLASVLAMLATLIGLHVVKDSVISRVDPQYTNGVSQALKIFFSSLVWQTVTIMAAMFLVALIAWISEPVGRAVAIRNLVGNTFGGTMHERIFSSDGRFTVWVGGHRRILQWAIVAALAAIMLLTRLTLFGLVLYSFLMLALVLAVEMIGGHSRT